MKEEGGWEVNRKMGEKGGEEERIGGKKAEGTDENIWQREEIRKRTAEGFCVFNEGEEKRETIGFGVKQKWLRGLLK